MRPLLSLTNRITANSLIRRMLGKLMQDPHDEDFEEGDLNVEQPVYGPTLKLISKIYGETRTVVVSFSFHLEFCRITLERCFKIIAFLSIIIIHRCTLCS